MKEIPENVKEAIEAEWSQQAEIGFAELGTYEFSELGDGEYQYVFPEAPEPFAVIEGKTGECYVARTDHGEA